ncbi:hypothetical protein B0H11DRAFT_2228783 [Mycena galericulata]|nr:hypothetical protein B0H11DRAFT_2228783 [Mycena galericulata]
MEGFSLDSGIPEMILYGIMQPVIGNLVEHLTAVTQGKAGKIDLAIAIPLGSSIQILFGVIPLVDLDIDLLTDGWPRPAPTDGRSGDGRPRRTGGAEPYPPRTPPAASAPLPASPSINKLMQELARTDPLGPDFEEAEEEPAGRGKRVRKPSAYLQSLQSGAGTTSNRPSDPGVPRGMRVPQVKPGAVEEEPADMVAHAESEDWPTEVTISQKKASRREWDTTAICHQNSLIMLI